MFYNLVYNTFHNVLVAFTFYSFFANRKYDKIFSINIFHNHFAIYFGFIGGVWVQGFRLEVIGWYPGSILLTSWCLIVGIPAPAPINPIVI